MMTKYVDMTGSVEEQNNIFEESFNAVSSSAVDRWDGDTYEITISDRIPASAVDKLLRVTGDYDHDTVIVTCDGVTFTSTTDTSLPDIRLVVEITRSDWRKRARSFLRRIRVMPFTDEDPYLMAVYTLYILSGGKPSNFKIYWKPSVITKDVTADLMQPAVV